MRAAIENAYPALVGSAPATANASQMSQQALQDLIFGRQATGPGLGTSGYLGSIAKLSAAGLVWHVRAVVGFVSARYGLAGLSVRRRHGRIGRGQPSTNDR